MVAKPKVNIIEVANRAGVSKSTVSRVVSDCGGAVSAKTREKVLNAIRELRYTRNTIAAGLRTQKTWIVLIMVPDIANPFWAEIARAAQDRLEAEGNSVVVGNTDWSEEREARYFELARAGRFDGMIINSVTNNIAGITELGIPEVMVGERAAAQDIDTVGTDTRIATRIALDHLWAKGHRRIAIATSEHGSERYLSLRRRTYEEFLAEKGVAHDPSIAFTVKLSEEGGRQFARSLLALERWRERVDAVFCGNDLLAIAAMDVLRGAGIEAGRDLSVVGMDDIPASALIRPALTTVRKPRALIGTTAAECLLARIRDPGRSRVRRLFPGELIERDSVVERRTGA
jgi:LacI family transcriptional regulator